MKTDFTIAIIGLGLIGGSFAKAIKHRTSCSVAGFDIQKQVLEEAKNAGAIDYVLFEDVSLQEMDMVIICLYPHQTIQFIHNHLKNFKKGSLLIDTCGIKRFVVREAEQILNGTDVYFVGAHPMAGREHSGFAYSLPDLFCGASMILTPGSDRFQLPFLKTFSKTLGFTHVEVTTPEHHDKMIAFTSQIAHVLSNAYVKSPNALKQKGFSAGSFKDLSRVAKLNEQMWTELFLLNRDCLGNELDILIKHLTQYRDALKNEDAGRLCSLLKSGRELKEQIES